MEMVLGTESLLKLKIKKAKAQEPGPQRKHSRISREDKRTIFVISKALEALPYEERINMLKALNIDQHSLIPKSE